MFKEYKNTKTINVFLFGLVMGLLTMFTFTYAWCYISFNAGVILSLCVPVIMFGILAIHSHVKHPFGINKT